MTSIDLTGSHLAMVTPLTPDRSIHTRDVEVLVRRAVEDGARGVLVAGSTGEGALLEPDQRAELTRTARTALDELGPDTPVTLLAGACGMTVPSLDADVARLAAAGADVVLVLAPHTYPLTAAELVAVHLDIAERAELPTLVYHLPERTGSWLDPPSLVELSQHPNVAGVKDSSTDVDRKIALISAGAHLDDLAVLTGHAPSLVPALAAGATGSITAVANLRQRQVTALHRAFTDGDDTTAEQLQSALGRLVAGLKQVGSTPAAMKAALQLDGIIEERWCRAPLSSVPPGRLDVLRTALLR